jgi:murein L,D-transpeptidase YafK
MRARRTTLGIVIAIAAGGLAVAGWDFLQLGRKAPDPAPADQRASLIVVEKSARRLTLLRDGQVLKTFEVALGAAPSGHKQQEGDGRTPEGAYAIDFKNARSRFHLALRISYPNAADRASAQRRGVPPGGDIMIHGLPNGLGWLAGLHLWRDWTDGCVAVTDAQIDEIWPLVDVGTAVEIKP